MKERGMRHGRALAFFPSVRAEKGRTPVIDFLFILRGSHEPATTLQLSIVQLPWPGQVRTSAGGAPILLRGRRNGYYGQRGVVCRLGRSVSLPLSFPRGFASQALCLCGCARARARNMGPGRSEVMIVWLWPNILHPGARIAQEMRPNSRRFKIVHCQQMVNAVMLTQLAEFLAMVLEGFCRPSH